ncbi:MAG: hypothetical protein ACRELB_03560, partial [Polyangiaceae bacterium]
PALAPAPAWLHAERVRFAFAFDPANRVLVLALLGACLLVVLLIVAAVAVGLSQRGVASEEGTPAASDTTAASEAPASAAPGRAPSPSPAAKSRSHGR